MAQKASQDMQIKSNFLNSLITILIILITQISITQANNYTMVIEPTYPIE